MIIIEREKLMVPASTNPNLKIPKLKKSNFMNPNFPNQPYPKPPINPISISPETLKNLTKSINFKGIKVPNDSWKSWVETLEKTHHNSWKKTGIFNAIKSSIFPIKKDDEFIIKLANYWCPETNTFVFPWGECTITLEDVMILGGFSPLGETVFKLKECSDNDIHVKLVNCCLDIKKRNNRHAPFSEWIKYFKGKSDDFELEHVGFLVQWLSRYVFCVNQFDVNVNMFSFAVFLSVGCRIALAPAVLASIYRDLTHLKRRIVCFDDDGGGDGYGDGKSKLVLWSPMQLVQVWGWERFPMFSPKPICLSVGEPRVARWRKLDKMRTVGVRVEVGMEKCLGGFLWRPYAKSVENWEFPKFYLEEARFVDVDEEVDEEWLAFARCLGVSELVGIDCVEQYLPHRVAMQFGYDQDITDFVPRLNDDLEVAWSSYDKPLDGVRLYVPPRLFEGEVTEEYSELWVRVSSSLGDALYEPRKKRKRKKQLSTQKASNLKEPPASASTTTSGCDNDKTIDLASRVTGSSEPANLIDKIDSSMAANGELFLEVPDTEGSSWVLSEDGQRNDTMEAEFYEWRHTFL